jgi:hypothetical protein
MKGYFLVFAAEAACAQTASVKPETVVLTVHGKLYTRAQTLEAEARRRGLDKDPAVLARLEIYKASLLSRAPFDNLSRRCTRTNRSPESGGKRRRARSNSGICGRS